jgi:CRP-like cAMP-binding protein
MQLDDVAAVLASADFFEVCDAEQRRLLAFVSEAKRFPAGGRLFTYGDISDGAYVLISGSLSASDKPDGEGEMRVISEPGTLLGELGLVLARPRRATVTAKTTAETLFVPRQAFLKLAAQFPALAERAAERIERDLSSFLGAIDQVRKRIQDKG